MLTNSSKLQSNLEGLLTRTPGQHSWRFWVSRSGEELKNLYCRQAPEDAKAASLGSPGLGWDNFDWTGKVPKKLKGMAPQATWYAQINSKCGEKGAPPVALMVKNPPAVEETWVSSLGQEDPLEKGMATHSSILAWKIPGPEEPGGL